MPPKEPPSSYFEKIEFSAVTAQIKNKQDSGQLDLQSSNVEAVTL